METSIVSEDQAPQSAVPDPAVVLDGLVSTLQSVESAIAGLQALREYTLALASRVAEVMAADDGARPGSEGSLRWDSVELAQRAAAAEIAAATRMSDRTVQRQMGQAVEFVDRFPATFEALAAGRISLTHARIIQDAGTGLDGPDALARFEAAVLPCAEQQAPVRLRRVAAREAEKAQPEALSGRHERAVAERWVRVVPLPDGMAELAATLPAAVAYGIHDRLTQMAKAHSELARKQAGATPGPAPETTRTIDQLRADLLSDLLLRGAPTGHDTPDGLLAAITARVDVTVPVLSLIGGAKTGDPAAADQSATVSGDSPVMDLDGRVPAELDGRHPVDPETARILAGQATAWNRVLTDPIIGAVLTVDRYRPGEDLRRLLTARDSRCRFPGCGMPARELDLDHTHDAALGGATTAANLAGLCRRHHTLKHQSRWTVRQSGGGDLEWTSPTGRIYTDSPPTPATNKRAKPSKRAKPPEPPTF
jgi:Domain of unknown function (DUF222)